MHVGSATNGGSINGAETTVTAAGASMIGLAEGPHDFYTDDASFNGLGLGSAVGTDDILATINGNILAAHWDAGDAPVKYYQRRCCNLYGGTLTPQSRQRP